MEYLAIWVFGAACGATATYYLRPAPSRSKVAVDPFIHAPVTGMGEAATSSFKERSKTGTTETPVSTWDRSLLIPAAAPGSKYASAYTPPQNSN